MYGLDYPTSENMLVGFETNDDAGVYKISEDQAIVQTLDFITPVVNDPYLYGQIAAANSLSDIFAMGAKVHTALNIVAYDSCNVSKEMLNDILRGGLDKVKEAEGVIIGGHSIEDLEMKYGMSVTGLVHPNKILRNCSVQEGDLLILTKPLGMGVITTAIKADMAPKSAIDKASFHMSFLNKKASELAVESGANALTDVTGFGLLGHLNEMLNNTFSVELDFQSIPIIEEVYDLAEMGLFPGGSYRNKEHLTGRISLQSSISEDEEMLLYDAQTSGGLIISLPENKAYELIEKFKNAGMEWCKIIGRITPNADKGIIIG